MGSSALYHSSEPHIQYIAELTTIPAGRLPMERGGRFFANLTNIERLNGKVADMTTFDVNHNWNRK